MKKNNLNNIQQGMTLVEVMIAMVLGSFLLTGVIQIFLSSQRNYRMQENLSRMQENGRFAIDFLSRDLRMAGLQGCFASAADNIANPTATTALDLVLPAGFNLQLTGNDSVANNWNAIACGGSNDCTVGSDAISYHYGQYCDNLTAPYMSSNTAQLKIPAGSPCNIAAGDLLLVSSCENADIFIATTASAAAGKQTISHGSNQNTQPHLNSLYGSDAQVFKLLTSTFFIREGASGLPALWKMDNARPASATNPVELVEGIENMQILYGADTNGDEAADYYVTAGTAGLDMNAVVSIRLSLLVVTLDDDLASKKRNYIYNGATIMPTDNRLRRVFSLTLAMRNRLS